MPWYTLLGLLLWLGVQDVVRAQDESLFEMDLEELLEVRISAVGVGATRQVQRVDAQQEARSHPAGASVLKLLSRLPGVHVSHADPWGSYGWSKRISIRGFTQNQLGFTLDRIPLGDQSYGNHNGLHPGRALSSENLALIELSQGGGTLETASSSNLGGTVHLLSRAPEAEPALRVEQTLGSSAARRSFVRADSGERGGLSAYLSLLHHATDKWKGEGPQRQSQLNGKLRWKTGAATLTGFVNLSRRVETDYVDLSLRSLAERGFDWDYYRPDWPRAIEAARTLCVPDFVVECDDAYYLGRGLRDDDLGYLSLDWRSGSGWSLTSSVYAHRNRGQGHWVTPYTPSAQVPLSLRVSDYRIERWGLLPTLAWQGAGHRLEFGAWYEDNRHDFSRFFVELDPQRPPDRARFERDPREVLFGQRFEVSTLQAFVQDRWLLDEGRLALDFGFKVVQVDYDAMRTAGERFAEGRLRARDLFLPKAAARWRSSERIEWFAAYGENLSVFRAGIDGPFATTQAAFDAFRDQLRPESARTLEAGVRWIGARSEAALTVYGVRFNNRLLEIESDSAILGTPNVFANVGAVHTRGVEFALQHRLGEQLQWNQSFTWNDSQYVDDYLSAGERVATAGKTVVDSPRQLLSSQLIWQWAPGWELRLGGKYTGSRFISYLNDARVASHVVVDAALNWSAPAPDWARSLELQLALGNLLDRDYIATVGSTGFPASDPAGQRHTLLAGAPRQIFFTLRADF
jgi:iron complex outermembrane receptor protein